jgi:hemerythrin-like domain-containing protein
VIPQITEARRSFLKKTWAFIALSLAGCPPSLASAQKTDEKMPEVLPTEDLMREHGVLRRILLIYEESIRRLDTGRDIPVESIAAASRIVRNFVEEYHEKLEEDFLFPRFRKVAGFADMVTILDQQHKAGRKLTDIIIRHAASKELKDPDSRRKLSQAMGQFIRMYRPHAAREDTVLFPALRGVVTPREFQSMGEEFEKREEDRYGYTGFARIVDQVADLEKSLGIYDLAKFTPVVST